MSAFSLIEVVLAIGIASFSLIVIFSLMPTGLTILHDAARANTEVEIFNRIGAELNYTPFYYRPGNTTGTNDYLGTYAGYESASNSSFPQYFDVDGNKLIGSGTAGAVYIVRCALVPGTATVPGAIPSTLWAPSSGTSTAFGELRSAVVAIGFHTDPNPNNDADPSLDQSWISADKRAFLLANKGN